jgi:hypothetical protein
VSREDKQEFDKLLDLAEDLQTKFDKLKLSELIHGLLAGSSTVGAVGAGLFWGLHVGREPPLVPILVSVLCLMAAVALSFRLTRVQMAVRRDSRALSQVEQIIREAQAAYLHDSSKLEEARVRIRISRLNIGRAETQD